MAVTEKQAEPVRRDSGLLLLLIAACPFGLIMWVQLFFAVQWSLSAAWTLAFGTQHDPAITATATAAPVIPAARVASPVLVAAPAFGASRPALTTRISGHGVIPD